MGAKFSTIVKFGFLPCKRQKPDSKDRCRKGRFFVILKYPSGAGIPHCWRLGDLWGILVAVLGVLAHKGVNLFFKAQGVIMGVSPVTPICHPA